MINQVKIGWRKTSLKKIAEINPHETLSMGKLSKYIPMENLAPFTRKISSYETKKYSGGMKFRNGDTIVARITPCLENGKTSYVDILEKNEVGFGSTEYIVFRERDGLSDAKFLYYYSISPIFRETAIRLMSGTSGRQRVQTDSLVNTSFTLPIAEEQKKIAGVLSPLDDKIELLRRENETLESIAQTLFKNWFVDFEFPDEEGKPYKSSGGKMIDSELGPIPTGWTTGALYEYIGIDFGYPFKSDQFNEVKKGLPLIRIRDLETGDPTFYTSEKHPDSCDINAGDILAGMDAEFRPHVWKGNKGVLNQRVCRFKPKNKVGHFYVLESIRPHLNFFEKTKYGTTVSHLGKSDLDSIKVINAPTRLVESFCGITESSFQKTINNNVQIQILSKLRDALLPKLMKGEIRIDNEN